MYKSEKRAQLKDFQCMNNYNAFPDVPRPECSPDGYYAPVQYLHGMAYCVDKHGNSIEDFKLPIHKADDMTCSKLN